MHIPLCSHLSSPIPQIPPPHARCAQGSPERIAAVALAAAAVVNDVAAEPRAQGRE